MSSHSTEFTEALSDAALRGVRVLVVEDSWPVAIGLKALLNDLGMEVIGPAATVFDAEHLAAEDRPEVAVIDINLKGEMAYALIDQLHDQGVRVVVVTACSVVPQAREKATAIVQKPFSEAHLLAALCEAAFERRSGARAPEI